MTDNLPVRTPADIRAFVDAERELYAYFTGLAKGLASAGMLPASRKAAMTPQQAALVMMHGHQMYGWPAMKSLKLLTCIHNRIGMISEAMVALVRERGMGTFAYDVQTGPPRVTISGTRTDTGETFTDTWTIERAQVAGLTGNEQYAKNALAMLRHRCEAEVCRALFPDVLAGEYAPEELYTIAPTEEPTQAESRAAQAKALLGAQPEGPAVDGQDVDMPSDRKEPAEVTGATAKPTVGSADEPAEAPQQADPAEQVQASIEEDLAREKMWALSEVPTVKFQAARKAAGVRDVHVSDMTVDEMQAILDELEG